MDATAKGIVFSLVCVLISAAGGEYNPPERILAVRPTFEGQTERPLRYQPDNGDFVIRNGKEFFNRPLYGGNAAFRADAGDLPELSLYLPGHVGNMRFGIRSGNRCLWLHEAQDVTARYRPGAMIYEIRDPLLGRAALRLSVVGLYDAEGVVVQIEQTAGSGPVNVMIAYGGVGGKKGKRSGDIGCESEPVSEFFQLRPEHCKGNVFEIAGRMFTLQSKAAQMGGAFSAGAVLSVADARKWSSLDKFAASVGRPTETPILLASVQTRRGEPAYTAVKRMGDNDAAIAPDDLAELYRQAEADRRAVAQCVMVETPDPYINAAVGALCAAADALWDEKQGSVMHGAVAWRSRYCGWRGPYANDAFGRHDRARRHLTYWAGQQNQKEFADVPQGPDPLSNYARSHPSKQTSGDIGGKHYDMNLVYMDALIRHFLWTGDMELAEQLWPVIERHMAWERRLFRRTFGPDQLVLYEAYAAIWASDDLQYSGGGVTHASAYNYFHNRMIAKIAEKLGKDGRAYAEEADLIGRGMRKYLWLQDGWYGEWKDLLGRQAVHPSAALWTFYHTIDSQAADAGQAWQMSRFVDTQIAHIPVHGGEISKGRYCTLPTTNWMPYTWSTNNVVMAEVAHTSLAYWQAGRPDKAFELFKGCILDSMFMGLCPGNAGMTTYFDMARGEAQRDFGDAVGTCSRAIIEGLFGVKPDLLTGELVIRPGLPGGWDYARLKHPEATFDYQRKGRTETYAIEQRFNRSLPIRLIIPAKSCQVKTLVVNGRPAGWTCAGGVGQPLIEIRAEGPKAEVVIQWSGQSIQAAQLPSVAAEGMPLNLRFGAGDLIGLFDPQGALSTYTMRPTRLEATVSNSPGHRTVFVKRGQGQMRWTEPLNFEVRPRYEILSTAEQTPDAVRFRVRNNMAQAIAGPVEFAVNGRTMVRNLKIKAYAESDEIACSAEAFSLLPGTPRIAARLADGYAFEGTVTNWHISSPAALGSLEPVKVEFNDLVTQIFRNEYLSPRSPYCSLSIPKQGIGSWCNFEKAFVADDRGLRESAGEKGRFQLPNGILFGTPGGADDFNVLFVSQWDNYPNEAAVKLSGKARHVYLLMAGSTNSMQSRFDNGIVTVHYADGTAERLALNNPVNWWPVDQDYFIDDFGFKRPEPVNPRVHLKTGRVVVGDPRDFGGQGIAIDGGAANVLDLPLNPAKELRSLHVSAEANEVVIGLMSVTLAR